MRNLVTKKVLEATKYLITWLSVEIRVMEGEDEKWLFLISVRDDLRKLNEMLKEEGKQNAI